MSWNAVNVALKFFFNLSSGLGRGLLAEECCLLLPGGSGGGLLLSDVDEPIS